MPTIPPRGCCRIPDVSDLRAGRMRLVVTNVFEVLSRNYGYVPVTCMPHVQTGDSGRR